MPMIIIAKDSSGKRWFRNVRQQWQETRDGHCHFPNAIEAGKAYHQAITVDRFLDPEDRMDEIEIVSLP